MATWRELKKDLGKYFRETNIVVIGDLTCDIMISYATEPVGQNRPSDFLQMSSSDRPVDTAVAGAAGVVVRVLRLLGVKAELFGGVGDDTYGKKVIESVKEDVWRGITEEGSNTTIKYRHYRRAYDGRNISDIKINYDLFPKEPDRYETLMNCSIDAVAKICETQQAGIIIADYGRGIITDNLLKEISKKVKDHKTDVILLTRGWKEMYRDKHLTHVFWDASELYSRCMAKLDEPNVDVAAEYIYQFIPAWFLKIGTCKELVVTVNDRQLFRFRSKNDTIDGYMYELKYEHILDLYKECINHTGFRSVLCTTYAAIRSAMKNQKVPGLKDVQKNPFSFALKAASVQLAQLGTNLPDEDELFKEMMKRELFVVIAHCPLKKKAPTNQILFNELRTALGKYNDDPGAVENEIRGLLTSPDFREFLGLGLDSEKIVNRIIDKLRQDNNLQRQLEKILERVKDSQKKTRFSPAEYKELLVFLIRVISQLFS